MKDVTSQAAATGAEAATGAAPAATTNAAPAGATTDADPAAAEEPGVSSTAACPVLTAALPNYWNDFN